LLLRDPPSADPRQCLEQTTKRISRCRNR